MLGQYSDRWVLGGMHLVLLATALIDACPDATLHAATPLPALEALVRIHAFLLSIVSFFIAVHRYLKYARC